MPTAAAAAVAPGALLPVPEFGAAAGAVQHSWAVGVGSALPPWALAVAIVALAALGARAAWRAWPGPWGRALALLRAAGTLLLIAVLLEPAVRRAELQRAPRAVAIVLDDSASMAAPAGGTTRMAQAEAAAAAAAQAWRQQDPELQVHRLGLGGPQRAGPTGPGSDLLAALGRAAADDAVDGVLLLSDGADTVHPSAEADGAALGPEARATLTALGVPVSTVLVAGDPVPDLRVGALVHDAFAFIKDTIHIEAPIEHLGIDAGEVRVTLARDGVPVAAQQVAWRGPAPGVARFEVRPEEVGEALYTVRAAAWPNEATLTNNARSAAVRVVRDKMRVLHVAGRPSWDARFLREALKCDSQVELVSFFILRSPTSDASVPESQLALIPFPIERLFTQELKNFDVALFQGFDARPFRMEAYLPNLAAAVEGGLGLMMLGGPDSLGAGGYAHSALARVMPCELGGEALVPGPRPLVLTPEGRTHPVFDLALGSAPGGAGGASAREALVARLPGLTDINVLGPLQPGGTWLAHAAGPGGAASLPVAAVREAGRGRTLVLASDGLWRWRVAGAGAAAGHGGDDGARAYARLVQQALRWLTHDPAQAPLRLTLPAREIVAGRAARAEIAAFDGAGAPDRHARIALSLEALGEAGEPRAGSTQTRVLAAGDAGVAVQGLEALAPGLWRLRARRAEGGPEADAVTAVLAVRAHDLEAEAMAARPGVLAAIREATGGRALALADGPPALRRLPRRPPPPGRVVGSSVQPLWDNAWVLGALTLLWGAEWLVRRRTGRA